MFRKKNPPHVSGFESNVVSNDQWLLSIIHHVDSKKTELLLQGFTGKEMVRKSMSQDLSEGGDYRVVINNTADYHAGRGDFSMSFGIKPEKGLQLFNNQEDNPRTVNRYALSFNNNNMQESSYRWARAKLLSVINFARLPANLEDFKAEVDSRREMLVTPKLG